MKALEPLERDLKRSMLKTLKITEELTENFFSLLKVNINSY
jgi:hypothetical protein